MCAKTSHFSHSCATLQCFVSRSAKYRLIMYFFLQALCLYYGFCNKAFAEWTKVGIQFRGRRIHNRVHWCRASAAQMYRFLWMILWWSYGSMDWQESTPSVLCISQDKHWERRTLSRASRRVVYSLNFQKNVMRNSVVKAGSADFISNPWEKWCRFFLFLFLCRCQSNFIFERLASNMYVKTFALFQKSDSQGFRQFWSNDQNPVLRVTSLNCSCYYPKLRTLS